MDGETIFVYQVGGAVGPDSESEVMIGELYSLMVIQVQVQVAP